VAVAVALSSLRPPPQPQLWMIHSLAGMMNKEVVQPGLPSQRPLHEMAAAVLPLSCKLPPKTKRVLAAESVDSSLIQLKK